MIQLNLDFLSECEALGYIVFYERADVTIVTIAVIHPRAKDWLWTYKVMNPDGSYTEDYPSLQDALNYLHTVVQP